MRRHPSGFTIIELLVGSVVTFVTVLAVTAAFLGYTQAFHTQAGIRGGQASLRQTHQMVMRNLRMAGYGIEPPLAFELPDGWYNDPAANNSDRLVFRMRNPRFHVRAASFSSTLISLDSPLPEPLSRGQILQVMCPGGVGWTYAQLKTDALAGELQVDVEAASGVFPRLNDFSKTCMTAPGSEVYLYKIDVYDYIVRFMDEDGNPVTPGRPYLFRRHGLAENDPDAFGEPVAEDIEALRVTFLRGDGTAFIPDASAMAPDYGTPLDDPRRLSNHPANIRAVRIGLVARSSTRDKSMAPGMLNVIPGFAGRPDLTGPEGFRRLLSEVTIYARNMESAEMPVPIYTKDTTAGACAGALPSDHFNCAGG